MKNLLPKTLSKTLFFGVLISTFSIINCQKPPSRRINPTVGDQKVTPTGAKIETCTPDIEKNYAALKLAQKALNDKLQSIKDIDLSKLKEEEKKVHTDEIKALTKDLNDKTEPVLSGISAINPEADGCKVVAKDDKGKDTIKETLEVKRISQVRQDLGKQAKAKTGEDNDLVKGGRTLTPQLSLKIKTLDLAETISDTESSDGKVAIAEGKIEKDASAIKALLSDVNKTACILKNSHSEKLELKLDTVIKVISIEFVNDEKSVRQIMDVSFEVKAPALTIVADSDVDAAEKKPQGNVLINLSCNLADKKASSIVDEQVDDKSTDKEKAARKLTHSEAAKEIREALGDMVE